jgi:hypothetical protein
VPEPPRRGQSGGNPRKPGAPRTGGSSGSGGRPVRREGAPDRTGRPAPDRTGRPAPDRAGRPAPDRAGRPAPDRAGRPARPTDRGGARSDRGGARPDRGASRPDRAARPARPTGPPLPPGADPALLPSEVRRELRALLDTVADRVAGHLVAAGQLLDEDPAAAYEHAKAAKAEAGRIGAVREAVGVTAYRAGDFATALAELKAARRITGQPDHLPLLADCERALGRPERALDLANDPDRARLDRPSRVELSIVVSGARRDLGQPEAAVLALQGPELDGDAVEEWTVRLWYAYADALLAAGRRDEALSWFTAVATIDDEGETDAEERLGELSRPAGE